MINLKRLHDAIYLRKSRADIELEKIGELETLARHQKILTELADRGGYNVTKIYKEVVSGENISSRPEMQKLLHDVKLGKYKNVLVMEVERLTRGAAKDQGEIAEAFKMSNTMIVTPAKTYDPNDEFDEEYFEFGLFMSRKGYKTIKRRLQSGRRESSREGNYVGSVPPYGYKVDKRGKNNVILKPHEKESEIVKMIFNLFVNERLSLHEIARRLTFMGIETKRGKPEWVPSTISQIIKNQVYNGMIRWNTTKQKSHFDGTNVVVKRIKNTNENEIVLTKGKHPAIIDSEMFEKAQELIKPKRQPKAKSTDLRNVFAGILRCKYCGKMLVYRHAPNKITRLMHRTSTYCKMKSAHYDDVMDSVIKALTKHLTDFEIELKEKDTEAEIKRYENTRKSLEKELVKLEAKKSRLFNILEEGLYTKEEFLERKEIITNDILKTYEALEGLVMPTEDELEEKIIQLSEVIKSIKNDNISISVRNQILKDMIDHIDYSHNGETFELEVYLV